MAYLLELATAVQVVQVKVSGHVAHSGRQTTAAAAAY